jgi:hypothetical protein
MATGDVGISNEKRQSISRKTARALASKWKAAYRNICENGGNLGERKLKAWQNRRKSKRPNAVGGGWRHVASASAKSGVAARKRRGGRISAAWRKMAGIEEKRRTARRIKRNYVLALANLLSVK